MWLVLENYDNLKYMINKKSELYRSKLFKFVCFVGRVEIWLLSLMFCCCYV